ncbi:oocyte zinc finger protein XlCOF6-like [Planococcus citri]|uniref:oocyte zinc finger protein XlCOF6-like n=1 Tax=Planococcus citri TaxID=170843 RepID=UPI0031F93CCA
MISAETILKGQHEEDCLPKLCRLCGKLKTPVISIFNKASRLFGYHDIINFHFKNIQVSKHDTLPLILCDDCSKFIASWHLFHNECIKVNAALLSVADKFQNKLIKSELDQPGTRSEIEVIEVDVVSDHDLDQCDVSSSVDVSSNNVSDTRNETQCAPGRYVFVDANATTIKAPAESCNTKVLSSSPAVSSNEGPKNVSKCSKCGSVFLKSKIESAQNRGMCYSCYLKITNSLKPYIPRVLLNYLVTDENKRKHFLCDLCEFSCDAHPDVFAQHYKTEHPQANLFMTFANQKNDPLKKFVNEKNGVRCYRCDICPLSCISRNVFVKHYAEHGNRTVMETVASALRIEFKGGKYCCAVCQKTFIKLNYAKKHYLRAHSEKKYKCNVCQRAFDSECKARKHEEYHQKIKSFVCDNCGRGFSIKVNLDNHVMKNLCSKYTCVSCCQTFAAKSALRSHLTRCDKQVNSAINRSKVENVLKFECGKCKKKFKSKWLLRIHIIDEFNLKPYQCFICNERFTTTVLLRKHKPLCNKSIVSENQSDKLSSIASANNDSHSCKLCGRTFRKIGYLRQHYRFHLITKSYVCQFCGKSYAQKASFRAHMLTEMNLRK